MKGAAVQIGGDINDEKEDIRQNRLKAAEER